jgi:DNA gyrase/topoisomerase IV subunit B
MDKAAIERAIEALEKVRKRPLMYLGAVTEETASLFLQGFGVACHAFGVKGIDLAEIVRNRGWEFGATGGNQCGLPA